MMDMIALIQSVGFPVAVTLWFMMRMEKILTSNTDAILQLKTVIVAHLAKV